VIFLCLPGSQPLATSKDHKILLLDPLTIDQPITGEYSRSRGVASDGAPEFTFLVKDGINDRVNGLTVAQRLNRPNWLIRAICKLNRFAFRIEPEEYRQGHNIEFDRYGLRLRVRSKGGRSLFGEISDGNQFVTERPGGTAINPAMALANNRGFVYAATCAVNVPYASSRYAPKRTFLILCCVLPCGLELEVSY
jgi:hypothetical protein